MFVKHGLTVQPGITITPILVYQCIINIILGLTHKVL